MIDYEKLEASRDVELEARAQAYLAQYGSYGQESYMTPHALISTFIHTKTGVDYNDSETELAQALEVHTLATVHHPATWNNPDYIDWFQQNWSEWRAQALTWNAAILAFGVKSGNHKVQAIAQRKREEISILDYLFTRTTPLHTLLEAQFQTLRLAFIARLDNVSHNARDLRNAFFVRPSKRTLESYLGFVEQRFILDRSSYPGESLPSHEVEIQAFDKLSVRLMIDSTL